eukprot:scaffold202456_cov28-Tisochrysis_lutea.AAC.2
MATARKREGLLVRQRRCLEAEQWRWRRLAFGVRARLILPPGPRAGHKRAVRRRAGTPRRFTRRIAHARGRTDPTAKRVAAWPAAVRGEHFLAPVANGLRQGRTTEKLNLSCDATSDRAARRQLGEGDILAPRHTAREEAATVIREGAAARAELKRLMAMRNHRATRTQRTPLQWQQRQWMQRERLRAMRVLTTRKVHLEVAFLAPIEHLVAEDTRALPRLLQPKCRRAPRASRHSPPMASRCVRDVRAHAAAHILASARQRCMGVPERAMR